MQIHQLQMSYSPEEDRIILRVGSTTDEEICLFLTRRLVNDFWTILVPAMKQSEPMLNDMQKTSEIPEVKKIKQEIQHQQIIEKSDYITPFNKGKESPVGQTPMLTTKISINTNDSNMTLFVFSSADGKNINLNLNQELVHNLYELIAKVLPSTNWGLVLEGATNTAFIENKTKSVLH
ncbi:conserved hypothetical protein [Abyssogena phaseoliformis symbiont OG214]|uniref:hypothetical protein n=1 Tax=Abyssogena phaseoliformis symbiont TaxID=596095 RepID=UPI00191518D4|nr:hypothetical protein [Abyssogena phaseoliformis symbiont]MBW5289692.1 hypothetical protein [Candidatus Ruthia sp. Apha_13_S6]BBB22981.1 conserved hypothetical protein [Abyssogena phaseoliformis symbiont OG214]